MLDSFCSASNSRQVIQSESRSTFSGDVRDVLIAKQKRSNVDARDMILRKKMSKVRRDGGLRKL